MADNESRIPLTFGAKASWLPWVADKLGYFADEGLDVTLLNKPQLKEYEAANGPIDVQVNWFQHAAFGVNNGKPYIAVAQLQDGIGMTVMTANDEVKSAADFGGRRIAEGASRSSKGILTSYLAARAGLPIGSYTPVFSELEGRREAVTQALEEGTVDVLTFMEPMTSFVKDTGRVNVLYDVSNRDGALKEFGTIWPGETILVSPTFLKENPDIVARVVRAIVRVLDWTKDHTPKDVVDLTGDTFYAGKDLDAILDTVTKRWDMTAKTYTNAPESAKLVVAAIKTGAYDDTESGQARAKARDLELDPTTLYTNEFVEAAQKA